MVNQWDFLGFKSTGVAEVDAILEEISTSAKLYHDATHWIDSPESEGKTRIEIIQDAANAVAEMIRTQEAS